MKHDPHFLTYLEMMNAPTPKQQARRVMQRWCLIVAVMASVGIGWALASKAYGKALHDAAYACQVGAVCQE